MFFCGGLNLNLLGFNKLLYVKFTFHGFSVKFTTFQRNCAN